MEKVSEACRPVVERLIGSGSRLDVLTGRSLGHPAHPAVVTVPLGSWTAALVLDIAGGRAYRRAAQLLVGIGVLGAVPAVATGAADWLDTRGAERRVATAHAAANKLALVLQAGSWLLRRRGRSSAGVYVSAMAMAVASAGSYLGGHLVYRRGVGVNTTAFDAGPTEWATLEAEGDAGDPLVAARAGGVALVVVMGHGGATHVLEDRCTHRGGPLHEGRVTDGCVSCPWHDSRFDLATGAVIKGPATAPQPVYEVKRDGAGVQVRRREDGDLRRNPVR